MSGMANPRYVGRYTEDYRNGKLKRSTYHGKEVVITTYYDEDEKEKEVIKTLVE